MPYEAVESNFYTAAAEPAEQGAATTKGNSSHAVRPRDRQQPEAFNDLVETRDSHGLFGHPPCKARIGRATFVPGHPTPTIRQDQRHHNIHDNHDAAVLLERIAEAESGLRSQSANQGESAVVAGHFH